MVAKDPLYVRRSMEQYSYRFGLDEGILFSAFRRYDEIRNELGGKMSDDALALGLLHFVCVEETHVGRSMNMLVAEAAMKEISLDSTYHRINANLHLVRLKNAAYPTADAFKEYLRT